MSLSANPLLVSAQALKSNKTDFPLPNAHVETVLTGTTVTAEPDKQLLTQTQSVPCTQKIQDEQVHVSIKH